MQLNSKEKQRCHNFIQNLKAQPSFLPFSHRLEPKFGYSDFDLIVTKKLDMQTIERNLKSGKYPTTKEFYRDLRQFFQNFALYAFEGDDICKTAKHSIKQIDEQQLLHHTPQFEAVIVQKQKKVKAPVQVILEHPQPNKKTANLSQKLQMIYLLRAQENNFPQVKRIGDTYKIGKMTQNQYTIKLQGTNWMQLLMKRP